MIFWRLLDVEDFICRDRPVYAFQACSLLAAASPLVGTGCWQLPENARLVHLSAVLYIQPT